MLFDDFHLTYCTNIHAGETWSEVQNNLERYAIQLKERLSSDRPFGIGLRLAAIAARELLEGDRLLQFRQWLEQNNLYVFTLNGFPYGEFHGSSVKDGVYAPDWSQSERLNYTLDLIKILGALLPEGMDGGISTLPLSYKPWWKEQPHRWQQVLQASSSHLATATAEMVRLRRETGKILHLDLEPEPDGAIENAAETIAFFQDWLLPLGGTGLAERLGVSRSQAETLLREHIRVCYDTCHFAVEYEDPARVLQRFAEAGIAIGKVQLSAALQVSISEALSQRQMLQQRLLPFAESTYLHQVIACHSDGQLQRYTDLDLALPDFERSPTSQWRIHFHVPLFVEDYGGLYSTQDDLIEVLHLLQETRACSHLEIETYTWDVLPEGMKLDLLASIEREYRWVQNQLSGVSYQLSAAKI